MFEYGPSPNEFDYRAALCRPRLIEIASELDIEYQEMLFTSEIHQLFDKDQFAEIEKRFKEFLCQEKKAAQAQ